MIGEGANLGMTQRGRIEAALRGVRLNTDAIDNSAGVNTSDVEVNIKIALSLPVRDGRLTLEARNALLGEMTDEVAALVLRNNYLQTLALSLAERRGLEDLGFQQRLMQTLEQRGELDRAVEFLPDDMEIAERGKRAAAADPAGARGAAGLCQALALRRAARIPRCPTIPISAASSAATSRRRSAQTYPDALEKHRLRREIIATQLANSMINRGGPSLVVRIADQTGASPAGIAAAFAAVRDSYDMPALNDEINALDGKVPGKVQLDLYAAVQDLLLDRLVWFLRNADLSRACRRRRALSRRASPRWRRRSTALPAEATAARAARAAELPNAGVPDALARRIADLPALAAAPDIVLVADRTGKPIAAIAATYFAAAAFFRLDRIGGRGARHRGVRLLRPAGARPRARLHRRRRAPAHRRDGGDRRSRAPTRSRPGSSRARPRSSASAPRSTRSPAAGSRSRSCRWRRACWAIWRGSESTCALDSNAVPCHAVDCRA